ncbi:966_t:CDS:2 [Racocetra fulgida]|uniref:966_t:CDS:1 n=1 Tax=Racocetra fulgida TaxID=60492 RepID=A0A9N8Z5B6_9GLOM|nr:966_t:CDS:2 [Racocetra fulgida]
MVVQLKFENSFWTAGNYQKGINILYDKLDQGNVENDEIIEFLKERIAVEELYGKKLCDLSQISNRPNGFQRDDGASLRRSFEIVKQECDQLGQAHLQMANNLSDLVLKPFLKQSEDYNKSLRASREEITGYLKLFDKMINEVEKSRTNYITKCQLAEEADKISAYEEETRSISEKDIQQDQSLTVTLGKYLFSEEEIMQFLAKMREEIPYKEIKIPFLGTYNEAYSGEDITDWLTRNHPNTLSWEDAESIGQELADQGFLKHIGAIGNYFVSTPVAYFQFKNKAFNLRDTEEVNSGIGWNGLIYAISTNQPSEKKRFRKEADEADEAYRHAEKNDENNEKKSVGMVYLNDRHPYRLVKDLIIHHDKIFNQQDTITTSSIVADVMRRSEITDVTRSRGDSVNYGAEHSALLRDKLSRLSSSESIEFSRPFTPQSPISRPIGPRPNPSKEDNHSGTSSPRDSYSVSNSLSRRRGIRRYSRMSSPSGKSRNQSSSSSERESFRHQQIDDDENGSDSSSNLSSPESPSLRFNTTRSHSRPSSDIFVLQKQGLLVDEELEFVPISPTHHPKAHYYNDD